MRLAWSLPPTTIMLPNLHQKNFNHQSVSRTKWYSTAQPNTMFSVFGSGTKTSNQMDTSIFHALVTWFSCAYWPKSCQSSQCDSLSFDRNYAKHILELEIVYNGFIHFHCFLFVVVDLMSQMRGRFWFSCFGHRVFMHFWHKSWQLPECDLSGKRNQMKWGWPHHV